MNCTAHNNGGDGFDVTAATTGSRLQSCVATNNTGWGFNTHTSAVLENCASYNNTSGRNSAASVDDQQVIVTADPWLNAASDDYRPNATASAGTLLRNTASGVIGQTNGRNIGAVQHAWSGSSGARLFTGM